MTDHFSITIICNLYDDDELLDIVDDNDRVIGQKKRFEVYQNSLTNIRVVNAFIENSKGQLWIPRRSALKKTYPLCLDTSMGGHVKSGESYEEAFKRELNEELNINIAKQQYEIFGYLTPEKHNVSAFMNIYRLFSNETPCYNNEDFIESFWLTPQQLIDRIFKGDSAKSDLKILVSIFYLNNK